MMKKYITILFFIFLSYPLWAQEEADMFCQGRLENGLTYYIRHTNAAPGRADFYLVQNVGALMEDENQNGLAHFLEHMAFNGSENFPEGIPHFLNRRGIRQFNAQTGQDETVYYISSAPTRDPLLVDSCVMVLRDWSGCLLLLPKEIDKERGVIFEERRIRRDVNARIREQTAPYVFNGSKYAIHNIIGLPEVLANFTPEELRAYYHDYYRPDLQAVIIVGDVDAAAMETRVKALFGVFPKREHPRSREVYTISDNPSPFYVQVTDGELTEPSITLLKRIPATPPVSLKDMMKENLIRQFYNRIVEKHLSAYFDTQDPDFLTTQVNYGRLVRHYNQWRIYVQAYPHKERQALQELVEQLERIHRFALNDRELQEQIRAYCPQLEENEAYKDKLSNEVYVQIYQNNFLEGKPITSIDEDLALTRTILAELKAEDLQAWVKTWYDNDCNWTFIVQGNDAAYPFPPAAEIAAILRDVRKADMAPLDLEVKAVPLMDFEPAAGKIIREKKIALPEAEEWTLANGCRVYYKSTDTDGIKVSLMGESPGGTSLLPAEDLPSATALTDLMLRSGLYHHDRRTLEAILRDHTVSASLSLGETFEGVAGYCDAPDAEMMFQLVYLFFEQPRFNRDDFDKYVYLNKMQRVNAPRTVNDTIGEQMQRLRLTESPRLWKTDARFFDAMSYDKMTAIFHDRFQDASDFCFYLTGNISREEAQRLVARYLGALPAIHRSEKPVRYDFCRRGSMTETIEANLPDERYLVNIGFNNRLKLRPADQLCLDIIEQVLSGRYREEIREEQGGAYGVNVKAVYTDDPEALQSLAIDFQSSVQKGDQMRAIVHDQIRRLTDEGPTAEEVEDAVLLMKKGRASMLANRGNAHWMEALRYYARTGQNLDTPATFEKVIDRIRPRDVQALARKFFTTAECVDIVIKSK